MLSLKFNLLFRHLKDLFCISLFVLLARPLCRVARNSLLSLLNLLIIPIPFLMIDFYRSISLRYCLIRIFLAAIVVIRLITVVISLVDFLLLNEKSFMGAWLINLVHSFVKTLLSWFIKRKLTLVLLLLFFDSLLFLHLFFLPSLID